MVCRHPRLPDKDRPTHSNEPCCTSGTFLKKKPLSACGNKAVAARRKPVRDMYWSLSVTAWRVGEDGEARSGTKERERVAASGSENTSPYARTYNPSVDSYCLQQPVEDLEWKTPVRRLRCRRRVVVRMATERRAWHDDDLMSGSILSPLLSISP